MKCECDDGPEPSEHYFEEKWKRWVAGRQPTYSMSDRPFDDHIALWCALQGYWAWMAQHQPEEMAA